MTARGDILVGYLRAHGLPACLVRSTARCLLAGLLLAPGGSVAAPVDDPATTEAGEDEAESGEAQVDGSTARVFEHLMITGGRERLDDTPGSAHLLSGEELRVQGYSDIHRLLRQVPGVNVQEEEGYGLRPNIGMRGSGVDRSSKITLLEDGVLIAPAPYAAPAAYYFPTPGRMAAVEVRKGSSAVRRGPFTLGGVLNMVSTGIPERRGGRVHASFGDDGSGRLHANLGSTGERFGWLVETYQLHSDGFKELDGGGPTGVELQDYLAKLRFQSRAGARLQQVAELKVGATSQLAHETYLGLTLDDFRSAPYRRYVASGADFLDTDHHQQHLRYLVQAGARLDVTVTLYRNRLARNWHKLQSVAGVEIRDVLESPVGFPDELALLRGELDDAGGSLLVRNNRRDYDSRGAEAVLGLSLDRPGVAHRLELGVRRHQDEEDRFQEDDRWSLVGGQMRLVARGRPGSQSNRVTGASVWAFYLQDEIRFGGWTLTPGVRYEMIDFERRDYGGEDPARTGDELAVTRNGVDVLIPGIGATFRLGERWHLLAGLYKGFAPPGPGSDGRTEAEESLNFEAGLRYHHDSTRAELVAFTNAYDSLLGRDTLSAGGGGSGDLFNGGEVLVRGLEASFDRTFRPGRHGGAVVPLRLGYTWTRGEFLSSFRSEFADWRPEVESGDRLPYLPEHQAFGQTGWRGGAWGIHLGLAFTDAMRTTPGRGPLRPETSTDSHLVADVSVERRLGRRWNLFLRVRNLGDEAYRVALRPAGARPGLARTMMVGGTWEF